MLGHEVDGPASLCDDAGCSTLTPTEASCASHAHNSRHSYNHLHCSGNGR